MNKTVFLSHSQKDKQLTNELCHALESYNIPCWIAPRNIKPGTSYAGQITKAIKDCALMILLFSEASNQSEHIDREIELCAKYRKVVIPFKIEDIPYSDEKEYYLSKTQWVDAFHDPKNYFKVLIDTIKENIGDLEVKQSNNNCNNVPPATHIPTDIQNTNGGSIISYLAENIGITVVGNGVRILAKKGSRLPFSYSRVFEIPPEKRKVLMADYVKVTSDKASECQFIGTLRLENLRVDSNGKALVEMKLEINESGQLFISLENIHPQFNKVFQNFGEVTIQKVDVSQKYALIYCPKCNSKLEVPSQGNTLVKCYNCSYEVQVLNTIIID